MEVVGEFGQLGNVAHLVAGAVTSTECRGTDVHCIGTVEHGFAADGGIAGRRE
jgi:hypothetical protein